MPADGNSKSTLNNFSLSLYSNKTCATPPAGEVGGISFEAEINRVAAYIKSADFSFHLFSFVYSSARLPHHHRPCLGARIITAGDK